MFVLRLPDQMESCECQGRLIGWGPSNTFGHRYLEAIPAFPGDGGNVTQPPYCLSNQLDSGSHLQTP